MPCTFIERATTLFSVAYRTTTAQVEFLQFPVYDAVNCNAVVVVVVVMAISLIVSRKKIYKMWSIIELDISCHRSVVSTLIAIRVR